MAKRIYVGNLPFSANEKQVSSLFQEWGTVESVHCWDEEEDDQGRRTRTAEVVMKDEAAARGALSGLRGKRLGGNSLNVSEARPRPDRRR